MERVAALRRPDWPAAGKKPLTAAAKPPRRGYLSARPSSAPPFFVFHGSFIRDSRNRKGPI